MRARALLPAVLTACLAVSVTATAQADQAAPEDARVRLTGQLIKTAVEEQTGRQWSAVRVDDRLVPVAGSDLADAPAGATVTLDVKVPRSVVKAAVADTTLTVPAVKTGASATRHRLSPTQLTAASDATPATSSSSIGTATTATALAPSTDPLEVTRVVSAQSTGSAAFTPATRKITYVEVTPRGMDREVLTKEAAEQQVATVDGYWRDQSSSELQIGIPTVKTGYTSAFTCGDDPMKLWSEAISRTGYQSSDNTSLVIKLPFAANTSCGYGLGSLGENPNSPGILHVADIAAPVLAHELGHNMSIDHANELVCPGGNDARLVDGWWDATCDEYEYGDALDIMGPSAQTATPMLSTPQALRTGMLPPSAAQRVGYGTTSVTLQPLSGLEGVRAAVITNVNTGVTYWVEYRTPTGRDADNPTEQDTGVRVLRLSPDSGTAVLDGSPTGYADNQVALAVGSTLTSYDGRITVTTDAASATQAEVRIVNTSRLGTFSMTSSPRITGTKAVGSALTVSTGSWSPTPSSYSYRWRRNGVSIPGATTRTYTPTTADAGRSLMATVTVRRTGYTPKSVHSPKVGIPIYATQRPYLRGTMRSGQTITTMVGAWTPRPSSYSYLWFRDGVAISGQTARTYTLTTRDKGKRVHAHVTARRTGYVTGASITPKRTVAR